MLVLHAVRGRLPDRRGQGQHSLSAAIATPMPAAFEPFEDFGEVASIAERLADPDAGARRVAVMALAETADPEAIAHLAAALGDDSRDVRLQAAIALGEFDGPEAAAALAGALGDPDAAAAQAAADS